MGYWENTAYIHCADVARIAAAMSKALGCENMREIPRPAELSPDQRRLLQYGRAIESSIWALALIPAKNGWTAIKTAPFELLLERPIGGSRARLADIAMALEADCFQYNIYDGAEWMLLECARDGRVRATGAAEQCSFIKFDENHSAVEFHGVPLDATEWIFRFQLIRGGGPMPRLGYGMEEHDSLGHEMQVAGNGHSNGVQVDHLIACRKLNIPNSRVHYFEKTE